MRAAFGFLTLAGGAAAPTPRTTLWFGPVGAVIGVVVGLAWWGAGEVWPPLVAAAVAVAVDAAVTGLLHLDGLADTADGLLPPLDRARRLAVMATPDVGAFGVVAVATVLALRIAALASLSPDPLLIGGLWAAARAAMALTVARAPYARTSGGLASAFGAQPLGTAPTPDDVSAPGGKSTDGVDMSGGESTRGVDVSSAAGPCAPPGRRSIRRCGEAGGRGAGVLSIGVVTLALVAALVGGAALVVVAIGWAAGSAAYLTLLGGFGAVVGLALRRIGGFTGDVLGAAGVVGETLGLLAASAQW